MMKKLVTKLLFGALALSVSGSLLADAAAVEAQYNKSCIACHASGAAGAPRTGVYKVR
jgi:cytochrome c5